MKKTYVNPDAPTITLNKSKSAKPSQNQTQPQKKKQRAPSPLNTFAEVDQFQRWIDNATPLTITYQTGEQEDVVITGVSQFSLFADNGVLIMKHSIRRLEEGSADALA